MPESQTEQLDPEVRRIVNAARGVWIRRLIDKSRANSLLFYRDLKVGTLDLSAETNAVECLLAGEAVRDKVLASKARFADSRDSLVRARAEAEALQNVRHTLVAIQRKALANREEKGIETLCVAMGMATWPTTDGGRPYDAPLLLLPARIEMRGRARDEMRLVVSGDPQLNPVLIHVLDETFEVRINETAALSKCRTQVENGQWRVNPECVFGYVERAAADLDGFEVKRRVILANFQFAKMAMVDDLKKHSDAMVKSAIVAAVAGHSPSRQRLAQAVVEVDRFALDERPAGDDHLVLDADSTQQRAIVLVSNGQNGVVQGPPGTGKSQTIANLIAQSIAEGRSVLFVAEKRAALNAVIKRLGHPDIGLGHLVLDLHGATVKRQEVMAQLDHALVQIRHSLPATGAEAVHREFEARRRQLNEHARRVNAARQPTALSVNQIAGRLLRLPAPAKSAVRLRGETLKALTAERVEEISRWVLDGAANATLLLGTHPSPWNNAEILDGRRAQEALDQASQAAELWPEFEAQCGALVLCLGVRPPATLDDVQTMLTVLRDLRRVRENYADGIFKAQPGELANGLAAAAGGSFAKAWAFLTDSAYRAARRKLLSLRNAPATVTTLHDEARAVHDALQRWRGLGATSGVPVDATQSTAFAVAFEELNVATTALGAITDAGAFAGMPLMVAADRIRALAGDRRTPYLLPGVNATRASLDSAGLGRFVDDLREHAVRPVHWTARFEYVWLYSAMEQVLAEDPGLATFKGRTHEQIVAEFVRLDRERVRLAAKRVRRLHAERAIEAMNLHFDQANLVKIAAGKKSPDIKLRDLLARAPDVLTRIAPCWVASPLSVSQLLAGGKQHFDVVVFDEASQILQEEAIPSLYRAGQVVVAGDRHQLPPTTFFATAVEGETTCRRRITPSPTRSQA